MNFFDPSRARQANGWPCWSEHPSIALPSIGIEPIESSEDFEDKLWLVRVMVWDDQKGGCWAEKRFPLAEAMLFLLAWTEWPEEALMKWFGVEAPKRKQRQQIEPTLSDPIVSEISMEDLGL